MVAKAFQSRKQIKKEAHGEGKLYKYCRRNATFYVAPRWRTIVNLLPGYSGGLRHRHRTIFSAETLFVAHDEDQK